MKPIEFDGHNTVIAKDQPPYLPLPAHVSDYNGVVTSCWSMSLGERLRVLFGGRVWLQQLAFGQPLQPQKITVERPTLYEVA